MEKGPISNLDQLVQKGIYESSNTDTKQLAKDLASPQDLNEVVREFDSGNTPLRDVGQLNSTHRQILLNYFEQGHLDKLWHAQPIVLNSPVNFLNKRVISGHNDQPIGHNFFVNATMFVDLGVDWVINFDRALKEKTGYTIYEIAASKDYVLKDRLLAHITNLQDKQLTESIAVYLAGRSLIGEKYLNEVYGSVMKEQKQQAFRVSHTIAETTGLRLDMLERNAQQLKRAAFGSFDHLCGLVTTNDTGVMGDYKPGSLRVEIQFNGSANNPSLKPYNVARLTIAHELQHAGSAQSNIRCGLMNGRREGLDANEGMTEYLAQLALGKPGINTLPDGRSSIGPGVAYHLATATMYSLHNQFNHGTNKHFAVLFNAYHGDVRSGAQLEDSLDAFYEIENTIRN